MADFKQMVIQRIVENANAIEQTRANLNVLMGQKAEAEHLLQSLLKAESEALKPPVANPATLDGSPEESNPEGQV
jgi:hypothetical protein